jgi:Outer membrane protein beta-barrel domain
LAAAPARLLACRDGFVGAPPKVNASKTFLERDSMKKAVSVLVATMALCGAASAQTYVTVSGGRGSHDLDCAGAATCDESGSAYKLMGGYKFKSNLAAEFGVLSFGKARAADPGVALAVTTSGFGGGVAFLGDLSPSWTLTARLGLAQVKTKIDATVSGVSASDSDSNAQLYAGLAIGYKITPSMSIDLAFDSSKTKYSKNGVSTSGNVSAVSVGFTAAF